MKTVTIDIDNTRTYSVIVIENGLDDKVIYNVATDDLGASGNALANMEVFEFMDELFANHQNEIEKSLKNEL